MAFVLTHMISDISVSVGYLWAGILVKKVGLFLGSLFLCVLLVAHFYYSQQTGLCDIGFY